MQGGQACTEGVCHIALVALGLEGGAGRLAVDDAAHLVHSHDVPTPLAAVATPGCRVTKRRRACAAAGGEGGGTAAQASKKADEG